MIIILGAMLASWVGGGMKFGELWNIDLTVTQKTALPQYGAIGGSSQDLVPQIL